MVEGAHAVLEEDEVHDVAELMEVELGDHHTGGVGGHEGGGEEGEAQGVRPHLLRGGGGGAEAGGEEGEEDGEGAEGEGEEEGEEEGGGAEGGGRVLPHTARVASHRLK